MPLISNRLYECSRFPLQQRMVVEGGFTSRITTLGQRHMVHCISDGTAAGQTKQVLVTAQTSPILNSWLEKYMTSYGHMNEAEYSEGPGKVLSEIEKVEQEMPFSGLSGLRPFLSARTRKEPSEFYRAIALAVPDANMPDIYLHQVFHPHGPMSYDLARFPGAKLMFLDIDGLPPGLEFSKLWLRFWIPSDQRTSLSSVYCGHRHNGRIGLWDLNRELIQSLKDHF